MTAPACTFASPIPTSAVVVRWRGISPPVASSVAPPVTVAVAGISPPASVVLG
ncbi:MAG TPA: hypothetical protein VK956_07235 [Verrucomicrobium sp.]|nr:hypothetical protein [Verrucomicrobium sp.]